MFTDIAVVTTREINLFNDTGNLTDTLQQPTADLQSMEFDPVNKVLFVSDDTKNSNYSIYAVSLQGDEAGAFKPFIQSENCINLIFSCQQNLLLSDLKICTQKVSQFRVSALMG
jgi:hypothetical protein